MERESVIIDAHAKSLGRIASEAARFLQGKHKPGWAPNQDSGVFVIIENLKEAKFTGNKSVTKLYYRHTNYPGNMKIATLREKWDKDPRKLFALVISRMLPKNKLRNSMMKRVKFK